MVISSSFYTHPIMLLSALVAIVIGIGKKNKLPELKLIILYPIASIIQGGIAYYSWTIELESTRWTADYISESLFILLEFLILSHFFRKVIFIKKLRTLIISISIIYMTYLTCMWIFTSTFYSSPYKIYLFESLCILLFCFIYLFQLFKLPPKLNLLSIPSFWITVGCLFYFSCTIPLFFADSILNYFVHHDNLYSINFLAYTIFFIIISKAFLCSKVQIKSQSLP